VESENPRRIWRLEEIHNFDMVVGCDSPTCSSFTNRTWPETEFNSCLLRRKEGPSFSNRLNQQYLFFF
jgi:hypothetical protein